MKNFAYLAACMAFISTSCTTTNRGSRPKDGAAGFSFPKEQVIAANVVAKIAPTKMIVAFEDETHSLDILSEKIPPVLSLWSACNTSTSNQVQVSHGSETEKTFCLRPKDPEDPASSRRLVEYSDNGGLESFMVAKISANDKLNNFWRLSTLCSKNEVEIFGQKTKFELTEEMPLPTIPYQIPGRQPMMATVTVCFRSSEVDHRKVTYRFAGYGVRVDQGEGKVERIEVLLASRDPKDLRLTFEMEVALQKKSMDLLYLKEAEK